VIRQAISCDICGAEKKQTNHWFVASEQAGELRIGGWSSRNRLRAGSKHLCGQTCLHKLVDEFMARTIAGRAAAPASAGPAPAEHADPEPARADIDASLTSAAAYSEMDSSARLIAHPAPAVPAGPLPGIVAARTAASVLAMPQRSLAEASIPFPPAPPPDEPPPYSSRRWRAEAWERERSRELRAVEHHPEILRRRKGF
jgi:hypothetical protein